MQPIRRTMAFSLAGVLLAAMPHLAQAQWWNSRSPTPPGKAAETDNAIRYTPALEEQAGEVIYQALQEGDFAKLDRMHDEFLEMNRAGGPGKRMLAAFTRALQASFEGERDTYEKLFTDWRKAAPESRLRAAAEGMFWWRLAWKARGGGYASAVSPEARKTFHEDLTHAAKVLEEGEARGKESPVWYWAVVSVGGSIGAPAQSLDRFFNEGATKFPGFMPLYNTRLNFLLPQWGGDYRRADAFIRAAVMRTQASEGTTLYSDLYTQVLHSYRGDDFFTTTAASWPLMRHAFEEEVARGSADLNRYATVACVARDRETTSRLLASLGDKAALGDGMQGFPAEKCKELVKDSK
jgi:uncharacterized protein DUF4034